MGPCENCDNEIQVGEDYMTECDQCGDWLCGSCYSEHYHEEEEFEDGKIQ